MKFDVLKGIKDIFVDGAVDLVRQYQAKSTRFVQIKALTWYIQAIKGARIQVLALTGAIFLVVVAASALVIAPITLVLLSPWTREVKIIVVAVLGVIDIALPLAILAHFLSEKSWMKFTQASRLMDEVLNK
jgi:hypothetical protein